MAAATKKRRERDFRHGLLYVTISSCHGSACITQQCGPNMQGTWPYCLPIPTPPKCDSVSADNNNLFVTLGVLPQGNCTRTVAVIFNYNYNEHDPDGHGNKNHGKNEGKIKIYRKVGNGAESLWLTVPVSGWWDSYYDGLDSFFYGKGQKIDQTPPGQSVSYRAEVTIISGVYNGNVNGHMRYGVASISISSTP